MPNTSGNEASTIHVFSAFSAITQINNKKLQCRFTCVLGFLHYFSVEETSHFSKMVAVFICCFYLLVVRTLTTTSDFSTINSVFVRPSVFVFAPGSLSICQITCSLAMVFSHLGCFSLVDFDCEAAQDIL